MAWSRQTIAMVRAAGDRPGDAAVIYGAAEALLDAVGATGQATVTRVQDRWLRRAREAVGEATFRDAVAGGRAMPLRQVLDLALRCERG